MQTVQTEEFSREDVVGSVKKGKMMVAAIDFGTTFSGYAYSMKSEYNDDNAAVRTYTKWNDGGSLLSLKAPTCVLFDKKKKFHSFGYQAENKYTDLALDGDHHQWYYFKRFKMRLLGKKITRDIELEDETKKPMLAQTVFGEVIKYLKDHLLGELKKQDTEMKVGDIHWVLTVPAIWTDSAKQFMREAAYVAGIDGALLSIALEPECASLYAQCIPKADMQVSDGAKVMILSPGSKYMIIDLGGGTADITVHLKQQDGSLKEIVKPSGGPWGGTKVDEQFNQLLIQIFGAPVFKSFCDDKKADYLDLQREFETKKRTITPETTDRVTVKIPASLVKMYERKHAETVEEAIDNSPLSGKIKWLEDNLKMRFDANLFKGLFTPSCDNITSHVKALLTSSDAVKGTNIFLLVGGFSECDMIQDAMRKALPKSKIIIPEGTGLAVLKGAVIFGHNPVKICSRVARYTFGINISPPFDPKAHPEDHKVAVGNLDRCRDVFKKYIVEGDTLCTGECRSGKHITLKPNQREMLLKVFASPKCDPKFVDEPECEYLGKVIVNLPDSDKNKKVKVNMMFGETELHVEAYEEDAYDADGTKFSSYFDFL